MASPSDFYIKRGDRLPAIARTLRFSDGSAIDLTSCTVEWKMVDKTTRAVKVNAAATVVSALEGKVEYSWAEGDTSAEGRFEGEWVVIYPDGKTLRVPTLNFVDVHVTRSLA